MTRNLTLHIEETPITVAEVLEDASEVHENSGNLFATVFQNQEIAEARLHVWSAHVEGSYVTKLKNTGVFPILRANVNNFRSQMQEQDVYVQLATFSKNLGLFRRANTIAFKNGFSVTGVWNSAWALINIFFTGSCTVLETAKVSGLGYSKSHNARIRIPVRSVSVHWDAD